MSMFDEIQAPLECAYCHSQAATTYPPIQTHLSAVPSGALYRLGDAIEVTPDLAGAGYLRIGESEGGALTVLEPWSCPVCGAWRWARLEIANGRLVRVAAVELREAVLAATDYISDDFVAFMTDEEREQLADRTRLRRALLRIQADIDAHRDEETGDG